MLDRDYPNRTLNISMLGYIKKKLQEYKHVTAKKLQTAHNHPSQKNWHRGTGPPPTQQLTKTQRKGNKTGSKNSGEYTLLLASH
jgi:hypothetical protein